MRKQGIIPGNHQDSVVAKYVPQNLQVYVQPSIFEAFDKELNLYK